MREARSPETMRADGTQEILLARCRVPQGGEDIATEKPPLSKSLADFKSIDGH